MVVVVSVVVVVDSVVVVDGGGGSVGGGGGTVVAWVGGVVAVGPVGVGPPVEGRTDTVVVDERLDCVVVDRRPVVSTARDCPPRADVRERADLLDGSPLNNVVDDMSGGTSPGAVGTPTCATCPPSLRSISSGKPRSAVTAATEQISTAIRRRS